MNSSLALRWGLLIGLANMVWLYLAFWVGMHTSTPTLFQLFMLGWLFLNIFGYLWGLKSMKRAAKSWSFLKGFGAGALMAITSAFIAVIAQIGYWKVVNPGWPDYMAQRTRELMEERGLPEAQIEAGVKATMEAMTMTSYAIQSALSALVLGLVLSALHMIFLRKPTEA